MSSPIKRSQFQDLKLCKTFNVEVVKDDSFKSKPSRTDKCLEKRTEFILTIPLGPEQCNVNETPRFLPHPLEVN